MIPVMIMTTSGGTPFKGFLVEARVPNTNSPLGQWVVTDTGNQQLLTCSTAGDSATHKNSNTKTETVLNWIVPTSNTPAEIIVLYPLFFVLSINFEGSIWKQIFIMISRNLYLQHIYQWRRQDFYREGTPWPLKSFTRPLRGPVLQPFRLVTKFKILK